MPENTSQIINVQRTYIKDLSLEVPDAPKVFQEQIQPQIAIDLDIKHNKLDKDLYEAMISITANAKKDEKTIFLAEVHQAGIFQVNGFTDEQLEHILNVYCPSFLFPYAREAISNLIARATFPPLYLTPINFEALHAQKKKEQDKDVKQEQGNETIH
jgi:preprotein translocase subunit SecB